MAVQPKLLPSKNSSSRPILLCGHCRVRSARVEQTGLISVKRAQKCIDNTMAAVTCSRSKFLCTQATQSTCVRKVALIFFVYCSLHIATDITPYSCNDVVMLKSTYSGGNTKPKFSSNTVGLKSFFRSTFFPRIFSLFMEPSI